MRQATIAQSWSEHCTIVQSKLQKTVEQGLGRGLGLSNGDTNWPYRRQSSSQRT